MGGVEAWAGMPLGWTNPLEVEVGGVSAWVGMGGGVGRGVWPHGRASNPLPCAVG